MKQQNDTFAFLQIFSSFFKEKDKEKIGIKVYPN